MCCIDIKEEELRDILYVTFQQGLVFEVACSCPFVLLQASLQTLVCPHCLHVESQYSLERIFKESPALISSIGNRLKFIVGLMFVHSFQYSRALFTHLFWFGLNKLIYLKCLENHQVHNQSAQQRFVFVDSEDVFFFH